LLEYEVRVVNNLDEEFDFYVDGEYQGTVPANRGKTYGISGGRHTLEARIGRLVVLSRTMDVDSDFRWTVYVSDFIN
jgi:hypothetical protein